MRLIPDAYYKPPVLRSLVDTDEELALLAELEGLTSGRLRVERSGLPDLDPRELAFTLRSGQLARWGVTYINAAFAYTRAGGNRFNDEARGAWYCSMHDRAEETAIAEVGFHKTRELDRIGVHEDETVYRALLADVIGDFPDLRSVKPVPTCLDPDPDDGYPAGQALARELRAAGHAGLIFPSVRRSGGTNFVAFEPTVIQNVRPAARWQLTWSGTPAFTVTAV